MLRQSLLRNVRGLRSTSRASTSPLIPRPQIRTPPVLSRTLLRPASSPLRWYSAEAETKEAPKEGSASEASAEGEAADPLSELKKQIEAKDKEILDLKDRYLRSVADFRNLQDRTQRDMKAARDFAIQKFAKDLVDSVDNLDRALTMVPEEKLKPKEEQSSEDVKDLVNLYEGLKMTENILMQTLKRHGLERFSPEGEKFNANEHEATFMAPQPGQEDNTVFYVEQKGFKLNGRVLRAAKVGIVKNK